MLAARRSVKPEASAAAGEDTILQVDGVSVEFGTVKALDRVSLRVLTGRTVAVVGGSGSGKSTLARVIAGLRAPFEGCMRFEGRDLPPSIKGRNRSELQRIQMIHQTPDTALNPRQTVREIVGRPLRFYFGMTGKDQDKRLAELLELTELGTRLTDRLPGELPAGRSTASASHAPSRPTRLWLSATR